jgi:hypothetical protein
MLMRNNCPVFQFKDCCFEVQKDREGAARVTLHVVRSRYGNSWILLTVLHYRFHFVVRISANMSFIILMWAFTKKSDMPSVNLCRITISLPKQKLKKQQKNCKVLQEILALMTLVKTQKTLTILEMRIKLYLPKKKMPEIPKTTKEVWREDKLETIQLRRIHCKRKSYRQV